MRFFWLRCVFPFRSLLSLIAARCNDNIQKYLGITLLPQAGVALGMAATAAQLSDGHMVRNVVLFSVPVYELSGPTLTKIALTAAGEQAGRSCMKGCFLSKCHAIIDEPCYFLYTEHSATGTIFLLCHRLAITGKG